MLKTIKTTKQLRLDELLKCCWDNHITSGIYNSNKKSFVRVLDSSNVIVVGCVSATDIFEVTYEEEITESTEFETLVSTYPPLGYSCDSFVDVYTNQTINGVISDDKTVGVETERIYALINDKLELIWERDNQ